MRKIFLCLDLGSDTIKAALGEVRDGGLCLEKIWSIKSKGIKNGVIENISDFNSTISDLLDIYKKNHPQAFKNIFYSISTPYLDSYISEGVVSVARADYEVTKEDIKRVNDSAFIFKSSPQNKIKIHNNVISYSLDDVLNIKDPLHMTGKRLTCYMLIAEVLSPIIKNLEKSFSLNKISTEGVIISPISSSCITIKEEDKKNGVISIDLGHTTTSISIYSDGNLIHLAVLPFGSFHITNDISLGLKISFDLADIIKNYYGVAYSKDIPLKSFISISKFIREEERSLSHRFLAEIIEARLLEIFEGIKKEIQKVDQKVQFREGIVFTGGGSKLPGLLKLASDFFGLQVRNFSIDEKIFLNINPSIKEDIYDSEWSSVLGSLYLVYKKEVGDTKKFKSPILNILNNILHHFLP